jgi:hypothetical protein
MATRTVRSASLVKLNSVAAANEQCSVSLCRAISWLFISAMMEIRLCLKDATHTENKHPPSNFACTRASRMVISRSHDRRSISPFQALRDFLPLF